MSANLGSPLVICSRCISRGFLKLPNKLLKPGMRNSELFGPTATRGPSTVATGEPLEYGVRRVDQDYPISSGALRSGDNAKHLFTRHTGLATTCRRACVGGFVPKCSQVGRKG